jgi:uncharacterized protein YecT (DUF1311 family)
MRVILAMTLCLALSGVGAAAGPNVNCADPQSNLEMKICASQNLNKAEGELGAALERALLAAKSQYESVRRDPGFESMPNMPEALRKAQYAWESFRDLNCDYQNLVYYGGTMASLAVTGCRLDMTKARIKELKDLVEQK